MAVLEQSREIEKMLKSDARKMKSTGSGVFKRASRRGHIRGGMKTPYDYMTTKQKKELNGEVKIYMLHQQDIKNVKPLEELMEMEPKLRLKYFAEVMEAHTVRDLCKLWGLSSSTLYKKYIPEIGYEKNTETSAKKAGRKKADPTNTPTKVKEKTSRSKKSKDTTKTEVNKTTNTKETKSINTKATTTLNIEEIEKAKQGMNVKFESEQVHDSNNSKLVQIVSTPDEENLNVSVENIPKVNYINEMVSKKPIFANQEFNFKGKYDSTHLDSIYNKLKILLESNTLYDVEINIKETDMNA